MNTSPGAIQESPAASPAPVIATDPVGDGSPVPRSVISTGRSERRNPSSSSSASPPSPAPLIYAAISAVMAEIGHIGKDKRNQQQGFMYRGIDDVMNALQPAMVRHGIFVVPTVLSREREERQTQRGGTLLYSILTVQFDFYAADGSSVRAVVIGEGMDSADKASNKAMSIAFKYACFQTFCIPTEEMQDPDADSPPPTTRKPRRPAPSDAAGDGSRREASPSGPVPPAAPVPDRPGPSLLGPDDVPFTMTDEPPLLCAGCGKPIAAHGRISAEEMAERTRKTFGEPLCYSCGMKRSEAAQSGGKE